MVQEEDKCPKCGEGGLDHKEKELEISRFMRNEDTVHSYYECPNCEFKGKEVYELVFTEHQTENGEVVDG